MIRIVALSTIWHLKEICYSLQNALCGQLQMMCQFLGVDLSIKGPGFCGNGDKQQHGNRDPDLREDLLKYACWKFHGSVAAKMCCLPTTANLAKKLTGNTEGSKIFYSIGRRSNRLPSQKFIFIGCRTSCLPHKSPASLPVPRPLICYLMMLCHTSVDRVTKPFAHLHTELPWGSLMHAGRGEKKAHLSPSQIPLHIRREHATTLQMAKE